MDTAQWTQGNGVQLPMEGNINTEEAAVVDHQRNNNYIHSKPAVSAPRPQKPQAINCPRCNSTHTKFCYYNNYSLSQPRYFCKTCRRYWTEGGSLRNVPVGGGSRKNKRSSASSSISNKLPHESTSIITSQQNPNIKIFHEGQDLNLAYPPITNPSYNLTSEQFVEFPNTISTSHHNNFSQFLKSEISGTSGRGFSSFMSMIPVSDSNNATTGLLYSSPTPAGSDLPFQEFSKTSGLNFSLNHHHHHQGFDHNSGGYLQGVQNSATNNPKLFNFPFEDLKQPAHVVTTTSTTHELMQGTSHHRQGDDHLQSNSGLIWNNGGLGGAGASCSRESSVNPIKYKTSRNNIAD